MQNFITCSLYSLIKGGILLKCILDAQDIMEILPHKYPFLLLDGVSSLEYRKSAEGFKNFTLNEWYFQGHMPGRPIVPGVLIVEALAQLTAVMYCSKSYVEKKQNGEIEDVSEQVGFLGNIKEMRFKRLVKPGERLRLTTEVMESYRNVFQVKVAAFSEEDECVAKGKLVVTQNLKD